ncbi:MAG: class I SAM-dependent methyltransferase [Alphaproteobacteria bacterium]|nr:class I SAM-dependent methyltransferase [Alphaproteobacteria bacterium]MBF0249205.1 class I SAM-dependent methyltransferase [Alphaproteobacteria bacterium]
MGEVEPLGHWSRDCPLCGRDNRALAEGEFSTVGWILKTCERCAMVYVESGDARRPPPGREASRFTRLRLRFALRKDFPTLVEVWAKPGAVLDMACGDGTRWDELSPAFVPFGIEADAERAAMAHGRFAARGGTCLNASLFGGLTAFVDRTCTAVVMRSCLAREMDPLAVLREAHRVLQPGGVVLVKTPNFASLNRLALGRRWCGLRPYEHLNHFTPATLRKMAEKAGFRAHYGLTYTLPTSDSMYVVLKKEGGESRAPRSCGGGCC